MKKLDDAMWDVADAFLLARQSLEALGDALNAVEVLLESKGEKKAKRRKGKER